MTDTVNVGPTLTKGWKTVSSFYFDGIVLHHQCFVDSIVGNAIFEVDLLVSAVGKIVF